MGFETHCYPAGMEERENKIRVKESLLLYSPLTRALAFLIADTVYWEREGFDMARSRTTFKGRADEKTATSFFTVFNVSRADIGMFNCVANNRLVTSSASKGAMLVVNCKFSVAPVCFADSCTLLSPVHCIVTRASVLSGSFSSLVFETSLGGFSD